MGQYVGSFGVDDDCEEPANADAARSRHWGSRTIRRELRKAAAVARMVN